MNLASSIGAVLAPFLWFDGKAEEAMRFCTAIFKNSRAVSVTRYGDGVMKAMRQMHKLDIGGPKRAYGQA